MQLLRIEGLPEEPLAAAATFHAAWLPQAQAALSGGDDLVLIFAPADHTHRAWRLAAVHGLAREYAPIRVNAVAVETEQGLSAALALLDRGQGITGQLLVLDEASMVSEPQ